MEKVVVIIPTYNEAENIGGAIDQLQQAFAPVGNYQLRILVFDSNSPDGTAQIVAEKQTQYPNITLLSENEKSGLGSAYVKAMQHASDQMNADIVFEFDADGSHRPDYFPLLLRCFDNGADVVVGSRFVKGGSIPTEWAFKRKFLSVAGNWLSRLVLHPSIKDYTSGFRGTRVTALKKINLDKLLSKNYAYKIHLMWELRCSGAKIVEYPINFIDREKGYSKFPKNNATESLSLIFKLRFLAIKRYFTFS